MKHEKIATFKFAVQKSLPVLFGYLFLGSAFGIMLYKAGYNWIWAVFISIVVYAGSGQVLHHLSVQRRILQQPHL